MAKAKKFNDFFQDPKNEGDMSDADFEALLSGSFAYESEVAEVEELENGDTVSGQVVRSTETEILVELDQKNLGWVDPSEYSSTSLPLVGDQIKALYERYDDEKGYAILSTSEVQREVMWEEVQIGSIYEATVTGTNKGGLTLEVNGERAFMPISQIELHRVEELEPYIGRKLRAELTSFDRNARELVLSRKNILQEEFEEDKIKAVAKFRVGDVIDGKVTRIGPHGAFVDIGGFQALLHISKIRLQRNEIGSSNLLEGQNIKVQIGHIDQEEGRVGLDFLQLTSGHWDQVQKDYEVGDRLTCLVRSSDGGGIILSLDEGVEGWAPADSDSNVKAGNLVQAEVTSLNNELKRLELKIW